MKQIDHVVFVLGMHRSGTSAVTRLLNILGADVGNNLLPGHKDVNLKGFWENKAIIDIHDTILTDLYATWYDFRPLPHGWWQDHRFMPYGEQLVRVLETDYASDQMVVIKEPRLCRLLPLWHTHVTPRIARQSSAVLMLRHPMEVVHSLVKRNGFDVEMVLRLWLAYVLESEYHSRGMNRAVLQYSMLLADWRREIDRLREALNLRWPHAEDGVAAMVEEELDISLRHHYARDDDKENITPAFACAMSVYQKLTTTDLDDSAVWLDDIRHRISSDPNYLGNLSDLCHRMSMAYFKKSTAYDALNKAHHRLKQVVQEKAENMSDAAMPPGWFHRIVRLLPRLRP